MASENARQLRQAEAQAEQAAFDGQVARVGNLEGSALEIQADVLKTINSATVRSKMLLELQTAEYLRLREQDKIMAQLARDRLIPEDQQCGNIKANGMICGKPLKKGQVECSPCREYQMRKPCNISPQEWDLEKERRAKERQRKKRARQLVNAKRVEERIIAKKVKSGVLPMILEQVLVEAEAEQPLCAACGEAMEPLHVEHCAKCDKLTHDWHECISEHPCVMDTHL